MLIIYLVITVLIITYFVWLFIQPKQGQTSSNRPLDSENQLPSSFESAFHEDVDQHVLKLLQNNQRIEAIKIIRGSKGWGLKQAKEYVEALEKSNSTPTPLSSLESESSEEWTQVVQRLFEQGKKIEAIKIVRQSTGWGLKEAKEYVESLAKDDSTTFPGESMISNQDLSRQELPQELNQVVKELLRQNRKVTAIKFVREKTGKGLKDAKEYVEQVANDQL